MNASHLKHYRRLSLYVSSSRRWAAIATAACIAFVGCSRPPTTIEGRVTLDGEPLEAAAMMFYPADGAAPTRHAFTDATGRFSAKVFPTKTAVTISFFRPTGEERDGQQVLDQAVPPRYLDPQKTVLVVEPVEARNTICDFPLTTKP